jgi:hypothetical protein
MNFEGFGSLSPLNKISNLHELHLKNFIKLHKKLNSLHVWWHRRSAECNLFLLLQDLANIMNVRFFCQ